MLRHGTAAWSSGDPTLRTGATCSQLEGTLLGQAQHQRAGSSGWAKWGLLGSEGDRWGGTPERAPAPLHQSQSLSPGAPGDLAELGDGGLGQTQLHPQEGRQNTSRTYEACLIYGSHWTLDPTRGFQGRGLSPCPGVSGGLPGGGALEQILERLDESWRDKDGASRAQRMCSEARWGQRDSYSLGCGHAQVLALGLSAAAGIQQGTRGSDPERHLWMLGRGAFLADSVTGPDWSKRATQDGHGQGPDREGGAVCSGLSSPLLPGIVLSLTSKLLLIPQCPPLGGPPGLRVCWGSPPPRPSHIPSHQ